MQKLIETFSPFWATFGGKTKYYLQYLSFTCETLFSHSHFTLIQVFISAVKQVFSWETHTSEKLTVFVGTPSHIINKKLHTRTQQAFTFLSQLRNNEQKVSDSQFTHSSFYLSCETYSKQVFSWETHTSEKLTVLVSPTKSFTLALHKHSRFYRVLSDFRHSKILTDKTEEADFIRWMWDVNDWWRKQSSVYFTVNMTTWLNEEILSRFWVSFVSWDSW